MRFAGQISCGLHMTNKSSSQHYFIVVIKERRFQSIMSGGLDTIPGQTGYLVVGADGAVAQSAGELQNDEHTAGIMLQMVKSSNKLLGTLSGEGKGAFHRVTVTYRKHSLVASVWNQKIYIVKRINRDP